MRLSSPDRHSLSPKKRVASRRPMLTAKLLLVARTIVPGVKTAFGVTEFRRHALELHRESETKCDSRVKSFGFEGSQFDVLRCVQGAFVGASSWLFQPTAASLPPCG